MFVLLVALLSIYQARWQAPAVPSMPGARSCARPGNGRLAHKNLNGL
jgi:hypothetical protein